MQWHAAQRVSQPVRAVDLHHVMGNDRPFTRADHCADLAQPSARRQSASSRGFGSARAGRHEHLRHGVETA